MRILLTGSRGFLGTYVKKELESRGHTVIEFDKKINYDLIHFNKVEDVDAVVHMAAMLLHDCEENPQASVLNNIYGTVRLLDAYKNKRFIYVSTWAAGLDLTAPYDITKRCAEHFVIAYSLRGLNSAIVRLGTAYGKGMSERGVIANYIRLAKENKPLIVHGRGEQIRQFTHAEDIARGIVTVLESNKQDLFTCVSDEVISINELAKLFGENIEYKEGNEFDNYVILNSDKLKLLGWKPEVKLKDGIEAMK